MKPVSPVAYDPETRWGISEITFAEDQPEYIPLPALRFNDGLVVTRWDLTIGERLRILFGGSIFLGLLTFNKPIQPIKLSTSIQEVVNVMPEEK